MTWRQIATIAAVALVLSGAVLLWRDTGFGLKATGGLPSFSGYVEADYVMIASAIGGTLTTLDVSRGDQVAAGAQIWPS